MASPQVLPNSSVSSKKQQQLEAGKKRLEEFRRKKAAAKKAASNNPVHSVNGDLDEKKPPVSETVRITNDTSDVGDRSITEGNEKKTIDINEGEPATHASPSSPSISSYDKQSANPGQTSSTDKKLRNHDALYGSVKDPHAPEEELKNVNYKSDAIDIEQHRAFHPPEEDIDINSHHHGNVRPEAALSNNSSNHLKDFTFTSPVMNQVALKNSSFEGSHGASLTKNSSHSNQLANGPMYEDSYYDIRRSLDGMSEHGYPSNHVDHLRSESSSSLWSPEVRSTSFRSDAVSSPSQASTSPAVTGRRSRPSFLDSINVSRNSYSSLPHAVTDKNNPFSSKVHPVDAPFSSASQSSIEMERKNDNHSAKQNEDFAALEQHIEDLTQEKFSLQRALEASRVLAESLATENSALTDSYNQQGGVAHQLKSDMERLQEEIKANMAELEAMRIEYGNAKLECSAADERAKLLASEVIGLEEKALKLRSNELKLERQLENLQDEMSSHKRRISSLEKERQDLQFTIDALQEEKKLLQSKLRKAPASGKSVEIKKSPTNKKEASTSTEDLVNEDEDTTSAATSTLEMSVPLGASTSSSMHFSLEVSTLSMPPDQMRMIQNINTLISELSLEKEELIQALSAESSRSSKLKDLNKELSQKLEVQTQRLELLTSQSMVSDNFPSRKSDSRTSVDNTPYADEGDEVVERVLGWIMKLFPGGPSRRQSKHL